MPIIDSNTGKVLVDYTIDELKQKSKEMRAWVMVAITCANSGHTGGSLSIMDIACVLYLKKIKHDPKNPNWEDRDRVFWSAGHKAPALYVSLGISGYFDIKEVVKLRRLWSGFEGHPDRFKIPGVEISSGSLGHGLGVAVGSALNAKLENKNYRVYCIMGDGEQQEGSIWESVMSAAHYKLDNLVGIIDRNKLQIDGPVEKVMNVEPLEEKYKSFGWHVITIDGHNIEQIINALDEAEKIKNKPTVIIADTIKGKAVSYAENVVEYHGIAPKHGICGGKETLEVALRDIGCTGLIDECKNLYSKIVEEYQKEVNKKVDSIIPKFSKNYWWNTAEKMKVKMVSTRDGFGKAIEKLSEDEKVVSLCADLTSSIRMDMFYKNHPERKNRFFSMGIAEANMTLVAAGLAKEGKIPFIGSFGVFATGRNWEQIRTSVCYNNLPVKIASGHSGINVGRDGATHQSLEDISNVYYLPNMKIVTAADVIELEKLVLQVAYVNGPVNIRFAREATPVVTKTDSPCKFSIANVIRYRGEKENFVDAFDIYLSTEYKSENEDLTIITCGILVPEAMRAAWILKEEFNVEARVLNVHTIKPIDKDAILKAVNDTGVIVIAEEHQVGGFGNIVAGIIVKEKKFEQPVIVDMIGVEDKFGSSGNAWELFKVFGLTAEFIAKKAKSLLDKKR